MDGCYKALKAIVAFCVTVKSLERADESEQEEMHRFIFAGVAHRSGVVHRGGAGMYPRQCNNENDSDIYQCPLPEHKQEYICRMPADKLQLLVMVRRSSHLLSTLSLSTLFI